MLNAGLAVTFLALAGSAAAAPKTPPPGEAPTAYAGAWSLSGVSEGDGTCVLTLTSEFGIGGWQMTVPKRCHTEVGLSDDAIFWNVAPSGAIRFVDGLRQPVITFEHTEDGAYVASNEGLALEKGDHRRQPHVVTPAERMSGQWNLVALGGEQLCPFALTSNATGTAGALRVMAPCRAPWSARAWAKWSISKGRITLADKAGKPIVSLKQGDIATFDGEDAKGDFLGLAKQFPPVN